MAEWTNPVFYLNFGGLVAAVLGFLWARRGGTARRAWLWPLAVFALGTGAHFVGDLFEVSEELDHIFIHGVLLASLAPVGWRFFAKERQRG